MTLIEQAKNIGVAFLDLIFPISCIVCGKDGLFLCLDCQQKLTKLDNQVCLVCYKPAPFGKTHPNCVSRNTVDGAIASLTYKDLRVHKIIQTFKYSFVFDLAASLSNFIVETIEKQNLSNYFKDFVIVPVPLHQRRFNWRGFNQSELLATTLAKKLNAPMVTNLIQRKKFTKPQVNLSQGERKKNLENAFELLSDVIDKKILLVDDLVTSGATANELSKLLKKSKASEVWVVSIAHG